MPLFIHYPPKTSLILHPSRAKNLPRSVIASHLRSQPLSLTPIRSQDDIQSQPASGKGPAGMVTAWRGSTACEHPSFLHQEPDPSLYRHRETLTHECVPRAHAHITWTSTCRQDTRRQRYADIIGDLQWWVFCRTENTTLGVCSNLVWLRGAHGKVTILPSEKLPTTKSIPVSSVSLGKKKQSM